MTVELSIVIAALSFAFAVYTGIINLRRAGRSEIKKDSAELVTVIVKLENIEKMLSELKAEEKENLGKIIDCIERLSAAEQQIKALNKAIFKGGKKDGLET